MNPRWNLTDALETVDPQPEHIEFALKVYQAGGPERRLSHIGRAMWPELKQPGQKAIRWWKKPEVQLAYRAVRERDENAIRVWFEKHNAGEERRVQVVAGIINGEKGASPTDRLKAVEYADKREGRVGRDDGLAATNVFTAFVFGAGVSPGLHPDQELCGVRSEVHVHPEQGTRDHAVPALADAAGSGAAQEAG